MYIIIYIYVSTCLLYEVLRLALETHPVFPGSIPFRFFPGIPGQGTRGVQQRLAGQELLREGGSKSASGFAFLVYFRSRWFVHVCCIYKNSAMVIQHF